MYYILDGIFTAKAMRLICTIILVSIFLSEIFANEETSTGASEGDHFSHLLHRISQSKRVHLTSELSRNGHRLQIEEFLDLSTWSQFIQFKWHEEIKNKDNPNRKLVTHKLNVLILNHEDEKFQVQYEPYTCNILELDSTKPNDLDWNLSSEADESKIKTSEIQSNIIQSILTNANNSPYLVRIPDGRVGEAWAFGISGLWMKAQYPGANSTPVYQLSYEENGKKVLDSFSWRLDLLDSRTSAFYYFDGLLLSNNDESMKRRIGPDSDFGSMNLIELRNSEGNHVKDLINVIDVDFEFSDTVAKNIFKLPRGYNCPTNSIHSKSNLNFGISQSVSKLSEFEVLATRYTDSEDAYQNHETVVKSIFIGASKHPLNTASFLSLIHLPEDGFKEVRDFHSRLRYTIETGDSTGTKCTIKGLHIFDFEHHQSRDPVEVHFNNGITFVYDEAFMDYLLFVGGSTRYGYRLLDRSQITPTKEEIILESEIDKSFRNLLTIVDKDQSKPEILGPMTVVRYYERTMKMSPYTSMKSRPGSLRLMKVTLVVFDSERRKKIAEVTFNLVKTDEPLSFSHRAKLFDVSKCYDPYKDTMQLIVTYPTEPILIDYADARSKELVEEFYKSSIMWWAPKQDDQYEMKLEKIRLAMSLNFLRVPRAEFRRPADGDGLELHLVIINKASPLHLFEQMIESTFETSDLDETLFLSSVGQCSSHCQLLRCRMFAFDEVSHECKISQVSFDLGDQDENANFAQQIRKPSSTIYYAPERSDAVDRQAPVDEANLDELLSYIEHNFETWKEITSQITNDSATDDKKRKINSIAEWPLFTIQFVDRSIKKEQYAPPITRFLAPSEVEVVRAPTSVSDFEEAQKLKVANSFITDQLDKSYVLNVLDDSETPESVRQSSERTFFKQNAPVYYTLRQFIVHDQDSCAQACHDIEEWDSTTGSEQICTSFSYCSEEQQCVLLIKTDFDFVESVLDSVDEGDRVYSANSTSTFLRSMPHCLVAKRKYLSRFHGPILIDPSLFGRASPSGRDHGLVAVWVKNPNVTVTDLNEVDESMEKCSRDCLRHNRDDQYCMAMDFQVKAVEEYSNWDLGCQFLVISVDSESFGIVGQLKNRLASPETISNTDTEAPDKNVTCTRYLVSHLLEFHHIKQRRLAQQMVVQLDSPTPPLRDMDLNNCALECSIRPTGCMAFEYCSNFDRNALILERNCSLYGRPTEDSGSTEDKDELDSLRNKQVTEYSRGCHVYLRREFKSLHDLIHNKDRPSSKLANSTTRLWVLVLSITMIGALIASAIMYRRKRG